MRKIVLMLTLVTLCFSCGSDKKEKKADNVATDVKKEEVKKKEPKFDFPVVDNLLKNTSLINLSATPHSFEEDIVFEEINVLKTAKDTYTVIFVVNDKETNFDTLKQWKVGMYFFAKDPKQFSNPAEVKKGFKTVAAPAQPKLMGNEVVLVAKDITIAPKEISLLRVYLYNSNNDMNKNYYNTKDIVLP